MAARSEAVEARIERGPEVAHESRRILGALLALSLGTFAYVTTENLPVGLLPELAQDLHHSRSVTGYLITGYAAVVVVASVPLAIATRRFSRRKLLIAALSVYVTGTALGAAAGSYGVLLATRMAIALSHAVFWAVVAAAAAALVPRERRGRAFGIVFSGVSLASVVGVPAITWLGQQTSWRVSTLATSALGLVALTAVIVLLPETPAEVEQAAAPHPSGKRYALVQAALGFAVIGAFSFLTYVTVFMTKLGGLPKGAISPILLVSGLTSAVGVLVASHYTTRRPRGVMAGGVGGIAGTLLLFSLFSHVGVADIVVFCAFGFALSCLAVGVQNRVLDLAPGSLNVASAGNSATFNIGIGGGALVGGLLLQGPGVRAIPITGSLVAACGLALLAAEPWILPTARRLRRVE
ncbi:MAG TPA: MFS transporter [Gaiellaceae bacterium]|nr:MFS transporter [Gaiellaceae bacterium]